MHNKRLVITFLATTISFVLNMGINFLLTPYIVAKIGSEAYGFISLANNFTNYIQLLTVALNSMAGRFITIEIEQGNQREANKYFNSVLTANIIICAVMFLPVTIMILCLNNIINITPALVTDVKLLFATIFAGFFISLLGSTFGTATFISNRLDINSYISTGHHIVRAVAMIGLFLFLPAKVWVVGMAGILAALFVFVMNVWCKKRLTPQIALSRKYFDIKNLLTILKSGIWNTITKVGVLIADGLDLLITNLFIDPVAMGTLAISKTVPGIITSFIGTLTAIFVPSLTISYAHSDKNDMLRNINKSINISSAISNIAYTALIVCGFEFFSLWVPSENAQILQILSVLAVLCNIMNGGISCLQQMYTVLNEVRIYSLVFLGTSFVSIGVVFTLLKFTNLGFYAVAGVSSCVAILRNLLFVIPYISKKLGYGWYKFYPVILKNIGAVLGCVAIQLYLKTFITIDGWLGLILIGAMSAVVSTLVNGILVLGKDGCKSIVKKIKKA